MLRGKCIKYHFYHSFKRLFSVSSLPSFLSFSAAKARNQTVICPEPDASETWPRYLLQLPRTQCSGETISLLLFLIAYLKIFTPNLNPETGVRLTVLLFFLITQCLAKVFTPLPSFLKVLITH